VTRHEDVNPRVLCHLGTLVVPGPGELGRGHLYRTHGPWVCKPQPGESEHQSTHGLYNHVDTSIVRDNIKSCEDIFQRHSK
jgi:hypothetical protein